MLMSIFSFSCMAQEKGNTSVKKEPLKNINALCELFKLNYASFEEKKINWKSICQESQIVT